MSEISLHAGNFSGAQQQQLLRTSMSAAKAHRDEVIAERDRLKAEWDAKKEKVVVTIKERGRPLGLELDQHSFPGINGVDPDGEIHRLNSDIGAKEGWKLHSMAAPRQYMTPLSVSVVHILHPRVPCCGTGFSEVL